MSGVFIAFKSTNPNDNNRLIVSPIKRADQFYSYYAFMGNPNISELNFNYPTNENPIKYTIKKYIDETSGNPGRFCVYINEKKEESLLSDNKTALERHAANQNRIMSQGGNRTKRSRKTKRSKRMHTAKRK